MTVLWRASSHLPDRPDYITLNTGSTDELGFAMEAVVHRERTPPKAPHFIFSRGGSLKMLRVSSLRTFSRIGLQLCAHCI